MRTRPCRWRPPIRPRMGTPPVLTSRTSPLVLFLALAGCAAPQNGPDPRPIPRIAEEINATLREKPLRLAPGDELEVVFPRLPEWSHATGVQEDGSASFLFLDRMEVAGLSLDELDARLTSAYSTYANEPDVTLFVRLRGAESAVVLGEVLDPGEVPVGSGLTLLEALGLAGGPRKDSARLGTTLLVRWDPSENRVLAWNIDARQEHWFSPVPILLQPHDVVYVPNTPIDRVNIWVDKYIRQMIPLPGFSSSRLVTP